MKSKFALVKSRAFKSAAAVVSVLAATAAHADIASSITAAGTAGESNVSLAVTAVIGIAALVMGVGIVLSLIRR